MKQKSFFISTILATLVLVFNSCTLFIDDDNLFDGKSKPLPTFHGKGYDEPVTEITENAEITYQLKETTMSLNEEDELSKYIVKTDTLANMKMIYFNKSVPKELLPQVGQVVVSGNTNLFEYGMCDLVYDVDENDGEFVIRTIITDYTNAYKELKVKAHHDLRKIFNTFEVYDEDGNYLGKIDQEEARQLKASSKRAKGITQLSTDDDDDDDEVDYDIDFEFLNTLVKTVILPLVKGPQVTEEIKPGLSASFDLSGGIVLPKTDVDFNANPFSDEDIYVNMDVGEGFLDIFIDAGLSFGMSDPKWLSFIPAKFEKIKSTFQKGAIVWDIFLKWGFQLDVNLSIKPRFRYPFGGKRIKMLDAKVHSLNGLLKKSSFWFEEFGIDGNIAFPMILLNIGAGIGTADATLNAEIIARNQLSGHVDFLDKHYIEDKFGLGFGVVFRAKGKWLSKLMTKIRKTVEKKFPRLSSFVQDQVGNYITEYLNTGTLEDWEAFENGNLEEIDPDLLNNMMVWAKETIFDFDESVKDKDSFSRKQTLKKIKEIKTIQNARAEEQRKKNPKKLKADPNDATDPKNVNKNFEWRIGPWYPKLVEWTILKRFLAPKMKDNSYKIGTKWEYVGNQKELVYIPEYNIKDIGLKTQFINDTKWKPGFRIYSGSEVVDEVELDDSHFITASTKEGTKFSTKLKGKSWLDSEATFVCEPYFRRYDGSVRTNNLVFESGLAFSTSTPAMSITKFKVSNAKYTVKNGKNEFTCDVSVYVSVRGMSNIREWGLRDNYDSDEYTKYHSNAQAGGVSDGPENADRGTFIMHFALKSSQMVTNMSLTPYTIPKGGSVSDMKLAKFYTTWDQKIDFGDYTTHSSGNSNASDFNDYTLTLESVEYIPLDDEMDEQNDYDYDYDDEE